MMNWVWLYLPMAIFLAYSAALWLVIKRSPTGPDAGGVNQMAPARATVTWDIEGPAARELEVARR
jgi:hypothetical protein